MKRMISFLLSFAILFTFCGARECLAVAGSGDAENPNILGESVDVSDEMTDALEPVEPKKSFWEKTKKGLECIGGLAAFAGLVAGGGYILNLFKADKVAGDKNLEEPENKYALDDLKEYVPESIQMNQIEEMNQTEIANLFFKEVNELENQNDKEEEQEDLEEKVEDLAKKEEEQEDLEEKVKRKGLETYSGTCGTNLTWNLDISTGVLTISGSGAMNNYSYYTSPRAPWYNNRESITSVVIGDSVTYIGKSAFYNCDNLESVTIPDSVETIGEFAFSSCNNLESATIGNRVKTIGDWAFSYCYSLTSIEIPNSVETIVGHAFFYCNKLKSVTIGKGVKTIGDDAFDDCDQLTTIDVATDNANYASENGVLFDKNLTTLIKYPEGKTETSYTIPGSVTTIGDWAFSSCSSLTSVKIGNGVKTIGNGAFSCCYSLTSIEIPNSVETIVGHAFSFCNKLKSVTIGNGVKTIGDGAFDGCDQLTTIDVDTDNANYASENGVLFDKNLATLIKYPEGKTETSYTIPGSVKTIGADAFRYCSSLTAVEIPGSVTTIGADAFRYCSSLTAVEIPGSVTTIGDYAFYYSSKLTTVRYLGVNPPTCNTGIFEGCTQVDKIKVPVKYNGESFCDKSVNKCLVTGNCGANEDILIWVLDTDTQILTISGSGEMENYGNYPYAPWHSYSKSITAVTIGDGVTSIGDLAFFICENLESVIIPDGVTSIGSKAFRGCRALTEVTIGSSVKTIGDYAFYDCENLESVTIPSSVTLIESGAFLGCDSLAKIEVDINNLNYTSEKGILFSKTKTQLIKYPAEKTDTNYTIPSSVTSIESGAFYYCKNLESVTIPDSVTSIGSMAFAGCISLKAMEIPDSVETIGNDAFASCSSLTTVKIPGSVKTIGADAFSYCSSLTAVEIPDSVISIGRQAFFECNSLKSVKIGNGVKTIGGGSVFAGCSALTSLEIGNSVTSIGYGAFKECSSLTSVTIPKSVTSIGGSIFCDCSSLESVTYLGDADPGSNSADVFKNCIKLITVKVPIKYNGTTFCGIPVDKPRITKPLQRIKKFPRIFL